MVDLKPPKSVFVALAENTIILLFILVSNRAWLVKPDLTIGRNWDFSFPTDVLADRIGVASDYMWHDAFANTTLLASHFFINKVFVFAAEFISIDYLVKLYFVVVFCLAFNSAKMALTRFSASTFITFIGAAIYAFSPYNFSLIISGSIYAWLAYAFLPLFLMKSFDALINPNSRNLLLMALFQFPVVCFLQFYLLGLGIVGLVALTCWIDQDVPKKQILKNIGTVTVTLIGLNSFWLLPITYSWVEFTANTINHTSVVNELPAVRDNTQSLFEIISGVGFSNRNFYYNSMTKYQQAIFLIGRIGLLILMLYFGFKKKNCRRLIVVFLIGSLLAFFVKGGNPPFGDITVWIYENVPLLRIYRSIQNIFFVVPLIFSILFVVTANDLGRKHHLILIVCLLFSLNGWFIIGDLGSARLQAEGKNFAEIYSNDAQVEAIYKNNSSRYLLHRELFIPSAKSAEFVSVEGGKNPQGGIADYYYLKNQGLFLESHAAFELSNLEYGLNYDLLAQHQVRYVTLRNDIKHHFWNEHDDYKANVLSTLETNLEKVFENDIAVTFRVEEFVAPFHLCPDFTERLSNTFFGVCRLNETTKKKQTKSALNCDSGRETVNYSKVSPVEYNVQISGLKLGCEYLLRFAQTFSKGWHILVVDEDKFEISGLSSSNLQFKDQKNKSASSVGAEEQFVSEMFFKSIQNNTLANSLSVLDLLINRRLSEQLIKPMDWNTISWRGFEPVTAVSLLPAELVETYPDILRYEGENKVNVSLVFYFVPQLYAYAGRLITITIFIGLCFCATPRIRNSAPK